MDETPEVAQTSAPPLTQTPNSINVLGASPEITSDSSGDELRLRLGEFAGPLDLLLYLIRQEQLSIYDIPVARITDE
ncbi:MAG TPA: hypothetical protein VEQ40_10445, partial [Pyrinomonadaceae bacterium]|nr:hypothetical protein [Pyrinomonadaceae bacterium]